MNLTALELFEIIGIDVVILIVGYITHCIDRIEIFAMEVRRTSSTPQLRSKTPDCLRLSTDTGKRSITKIVDFREQLYTLYMTQRDMVRYAPLIKVYHRVQIQ